METNSKCARGLVLFAGLAAIAAPASLRSAEAAKEGTLRICGADALVPLVQKWAEEYKASHPGMAIEVTGGGAGKGVKEAMAARVEIGMVSRDLDAMEAKRLMAVAVAKDAVFATISASNPDAIALKEKGLSKKAVKSLWVGGKPATWGDLAGSGRKDGVKAYTREDPCGAAEMWAKFLDSAQSDLKGVPVKGDKDLAKAVTGDGLGLGYNNLGAVFNPKTGAPIDGLAVVSIDVDGNGRIDPPEDVSTLEKAKAAIRDGKYPAPPARVLYLVTKGRFEGPAREFLRWVLTDGQQQVDALGFVRIPDKEIQESIGKLGK